MVSSAGASDLKKSMHTAEREDPLRNTVHEASQGRGLLRPDHTPPKHRHSAPLFAARAGLGFHTSAQNFDPEGFFFDHLDTVQT